MCCQTHDTEDLCTVKDVSNIKKCNQHIPTNKKLSVHHYGQGHGRQPFATLPMSTTAPAGYTLVSVYLEHQGIAFRSSKDIYGVLLAFAHGALDVLV